MAENKTVQTTGGIGFAGLLTIVLVLLKAFDKIAISWFWVFAPVIFSAALGLLVLVVVLILAVVAQK